MESMESTEISPHQVRVYDCVARSKRWITNNEIATAAKVSSRTARHHTRILFSLGIFDQVRLFPDYAYRLSDKRRNSDYMARLEKAQEIFGSLAEAG